MVQTVPGGSQPSRNARWLRRGVIALLVLVAGYVAYGRLDRYFLDRSLVIASPDSIPSQPRLLTYANTLGRAAYSERCASCHGADLKGDQKKGIPDLTDADWLYDYGRISDIERTVLYGIRSGVGKSHNVTDMPGIGLQKALNKDEIKDVIAYVLSLSKHEGDPAAIERGSKIFQDKGVCYDCHSRDASGVPDYGAPNLTDDVWLYGGDYDTIYKSVYDGRHGRCPGWIGQLSFATIRAIAVYVHANSKESPESPLRSAKSANAGISG